MQRHLINVTWHYCDQVNCAFRAKTVDNLKNHQMYMHSINVVWHDCDVVECGFRAKTANQINRHRMFKHGIGVQWKKCDVHVGGDAVGGICGTVAKTLGEMKLHKLHKHGIGGVEQLCDVDGCDYVGKTASSLSTHRRTVHLIGKSDEERKRGGCVETRGQSVWGVLLFTPTYLA